MVLQENIACHILSLSTHCHVEFIDKTKANRNVLSIRLWLNCIILLTL